MQTRTLRTTFVLRPALVVSIAVGGCTVGPDFKSPEAHGPGDYSIPSAAEDARISQVTTDPAQVEAWWRSLNDPMLDSLIERAVAANLDVQAATARILQARGQLGVVTGTNLPQIDANADAVRTRQPVNTALGSVTGQTSNAFRVGLDASWEIDVFGGIRRQIEAAGAQVDFAIEDRRDVLVTLTSEVALNYVTLRGIQEQLRVARGNLEVQQRSLDITTRKFEGGLTSKLDVSNAQAQVATTSAIIPTFEENKRITIYNISVLLGREPLALVDELDPPGPIPGLPDTVPAGLPSDLLRRRPDIRRQEASLHAATANIGVATSDLFPKFFLTGSAGLRSSDIDSLFNANQRTWSIGPSITWPVFAGGSIRSNIVFTQAAAQEAIIGYRRTILTALFDVQSSLESYAREQERRAALLRSVAANRESVNTANALYSAGQTEFLNVLDAQRSLLVTEDALAVSNRTLTTNLIALYKALGGGWESTEPAEYTTGSAASMPAEPPDPDAPPGN